MEQELQEERTEIRKKEKVGSTSLSRLGTTWHKAGAMARSEHIGARHLPVPLRP